MSTFFRVTGSTDRNFSPWHRRHRKDATHAPNLPRHYV